MDIELTEEQQLIQKTARELADREIRPIAAKLDEEHRYPAEIVAQMGQLGFMGMAVPAEWGGAGLDTVAYVLALEEISAACASTGVIMSVNNSLVCDPILRYGTDEQKRTWLTPLAQGKLLGCYALSEPQAGSDAGAQKTTALPDGDGWVLNGTKNFITNGPVAQVCVAYAMTDRAAGTRGISGFIVPLDLPGVRIGPHERKLGICASPCSQIFFEDVKLPGSALLGKVGEGFKVAMTTLDGGRIGIAAQALGIGRAALEESVRYAAERETFGKPIGQHQAIQFMIADMATELDAARLLVWRAASMKDQKVKHSKESSMAKLFASEVANRVATKAVQIHGGYGYLKDFPAERHFRDAKITEIYEGTSEIQRLVIAAAMLKE